MRPLLASPAADLAPSPSVRARLADLRVLLKPGIAGHVVFAAAAGYLLGVEGAVDWPTLVGLLLGTALASGGAGAINHAAEGRWDAQMERTQHRPVAANRVRAPFAFLYGIALTAAGLVVLALTTNALTTALAAATVGAYVLVYTPLKRRTWLNTLVGSVPGALPALGGVTAATGAIGAIGSVVFGILFLWQLPHFYALAWTYRADYARGGFRMLPVVEPDGRATARHVLVASLLLLVVGLLPTALGQAGWLYFVGMAALGTAFTLPAFSFHAEPTDERARRLFLASVVYVPAFLALIVVDFLLR
ncbi:MAG TPA: heme o synthase [Rubricoccaceae bacterium]|nr:heme o synthase [Rubricoccaceae bacterium]